MKLKKHNVQAVVATTMDSNIFTGREDLDYPSTCPVLTVHTDTRTQTLLYNKLYIYSAASNDRSRGQRHIRTMEAQRSTYNAS